MGIIESVQQYDLNIPVGGAQAIDVAGDRVQFLTAVDPFAAIEIRPNFAQGNISLKPGQGFKFSEQVTRWVVLNKGSLPLTGYLLMGSGDFFDQRIAGTVEVIDGGKARTLANVAMAGYAVRSQVAAQNGRVQLWNPAGSGKRLCVEAVMLNASGTGPYVGYMSINATALGTKGFNGSPKISGGVNSVAYFNVDSIAASPAVSGAISVVSLAASTTQEKRFIEPVLIMPGYGLLIWATVPNVDVAAAFEWYEEAF